MTIATEISKEVAKHRSDAARVQFGKVSSVAPIEVSFDGETSIPCYVSPGVQTVIGERVAVLKHGNAPGIILGISASAPAGITGAWIAAGTITAINIAAGTITAALIEAHSITAEQIKAGTITATEIKAGTITSNEIKALSIEAGVIAANAITATKIAANAIEAGHIKAEAIETGKIKAEAVTAAKIAANTITAAKITAGTISATEIAADAITAVKIKAGEVTATKIAAGAIESGHLSAGAVTSGAILSGAVTSGKIAATAIDAMTITGATFRTSASGKRAVFDSTGIRLYDALEAVVFNADASTGSLTLKGTIQTGSSVPATTVTGQLTNAQLKEIEAAKLTGQVAGGQIAANAIESSHIVAGTILSGDIGAGEIKATNIASDAIESKHILAGTIQAGDIQSNTITALQIGAEAIGTEELSAKAVTAGKINVETLSAITANIGEVTAGNITGVTLTLPQAETPTSANALNWKQSGTVTQFISAYGKVGAEGYRDIIMGTGPSYNIASGESAIRLQSSDAGSEAFDLCTLQTGTKFTTVMNSEGGSNFIQNPTVSKRILNAAGSVSTEWTEESTISQVKTVTHELGATPTSIQLTCGSSEGATVPVTARYIEGSKTSTQFKFRLQAPVKVTKGTKVLVDWVAIV